MKLNKIESGKKNDFETYNGNNQKTKSDLISNPIFKCLILRCSHQIIGVIVLLFVFCIRHFSWIPRL